MASVTFKRGTRAEIEATAKQDGQILMETDQTNNKMYVDLQNNNRVRIGNSNVDDISGITDSLTATSSNIALSAAGGNNLQRQIDTLNSNLEVEDITSKCTIKDKVTNAKIIKYGKLVYVYFEISCTGSTTDVISGLPYCISNYYISSVYHNESPYMPMQSSAWVISSKVDIYTKENIPNGYVSFSYICK